MLSTTNIAATIVKSNIIDIAIKTKNIYILKNLKDRDEITKKDILGNLLYKACSNFDFENLSKLVSIFGLTISDFRVKSDLGFVPLRELIHWKFRVDDIIKILKVTKEDILFKDEDGNTVIHYVMSGYDPLLVERDLTTLVTKFDIKRKDLEIKNKRGISSRYYIKYYSIRPAGSTMAIESLRDKHVDIDKIFAKENSNFKSIIKKYCNSLCFSFTF